MVSRLPLLLAALWLTACTGSSTDPKDSAVVVDDTDESDAPPAPPARPSVRFLNPAPGTLDDLVATIDNAEDDVTYVWTWTMDATPRPDVTAETVAADKTARGQVWTATVTGQRDGLVSPQGAASVTVINTAPSVTVAILPADATTESTLTAALTADDPDGDDVTATYRWTIGGAVAAQTGDTIPAGLARKGMVVSVVATPTDGDATGAGATAELTIRNAQPRVVSASLAPVAPDTRTSVRVTSQGVDADGDALTKIHEWTVAGTIVTAVTSSELPGQYFRKGDVISARVRADDGNRLSDWFATNTATVVNTPPQAVGVSLTPAQGDVTTTFTCAGTGYADLDDDPEQWHYRWLLGGAPIAGATSATLAAPSFARGDTIRCEAAPFDGDVEGTWLSSSTVTIANARPVLASMAMSTYTPREGYAVEALPGATSDADGDAVTVTTQWYVNGIAGPVGRYLSPLYFAPGDEVWVVGTPSDGTDNGVAVSSPRGTVQNTPPVATYVDISPDEPTTENTLSVTALGTDQDQQQLTWTFVWRNGQVELQRGASDRLDRSLTHRGDIITVEGIPNDGYVDGTPLTSAAVTVINTAPTLASATLTPQGATVESTLTCTPNGYFDADGDAAHPRFAWRVAGATIGPTTATLAAPNFRKGQQVQCTVTANDGTADGTTVNSNSLVIANAPPRVASLTLDNPAPAAGDPMTATAQGVVDPDTADTVTLRWRWLVNGAQASTDPVLEGTWVTPGATVQAEVRPWDGTIEGAPVTSATITVSNAAPVIESLTITPDRLNILEPAIAAWSATDDDGDPLTATFTWYVDGAEVAGVTGPALDETYFTRFAEVAVDLVVSDGRSTASASAGPVVVRNLPPTIASAAITPAQAYETSTLVCNPSGGSDPEADPITYLYFWRVNGRIAGDQSTLTGDEYRRGDQVTCQVAPTDGLPDGVGVARTSPAVTILNTPPTVARATLSTTTPGSREPLTVTPSGAYDADLDNVSYRYAWTVNGSLVAVTTPTIDEVWYSRGDTVQARVTPWDGTDEGPAIWSDTATVQNGRPTIGYVGVTPPSPTLADTLTAAVTAADPDGDALTYTYEWLVDGSTVQSGASDTLAPGNFGTGDLVWVIVIASDGAAFSDAMASIPIRVGNTPPTMTSASITPTTIREATTARCEPQGWFDADGDLPGYRYQWLVDGVPDVTTQTITGLRFRRGQVLRCSVTPWDGTDEGPAVTSGPVTVLNTAPAVGLVTLTRTQPTEGTPIGVTIASRTDADNDPLTTTISWLVNNTAVLTADQITGAHFNRGDTVQARVSVTDGTDTTVVMSNTVTVVNSLPRVASLTIAPTEPDTDDTVTATFTTADDDPNDTVTVTFTWRVNGVVVPNVTGPTLTGDHFVKHDSVYVTAVPNDGIANGNTATSNTVQVVNTPPVLAEVHIEGGPATRSATLRCVTSGASDLDADTVTPTFGWYINGTLITTSDTLVGTAMVRGDVVFCTATPYDQEDYGATLTSTSLTVQNSPPVVASVDITPTPPRKGDVLGLVIGPITDADGDPVTRSFRWFVNSVQVSTQNGIDSTLFSRGDRVRAEVIPNDGFVSGAPTSSPEVTVVNAPPVLTAGPSLSPDVLTKRDTVTVTAAVGNDPDGDTVTWYYDFYVNGTRVQTGTTRTLAPTFFVRGNTVYARVYGSDGMDTGAYRQTSTVTVTNALPGTPTLAITPTRPRAGVDNLVCTVSASGVDPDGDAVTNELQWYRAGIPVTGITVGNTLTMAAVNTGPGELWVCHGRTRDPNGPGLWTQASVTVAATISEASCRDLRVLGDRSDGRRTLHTDAGDVDAWCDQTTAGGGWTRVIRTEGAERDWGQATYDLIEQPADVDAPEGVYAAFDTVRRFDELMLRQVDGAQAGRWARFALVMDNDGLTLREILESCRDEAPAPGDDHAFVRPAVVSHTAYASALYVDGGLRVAGAGGAPAVPTHAFVCGVNLTGDNDVSYLAFSDASGLDAAWTGWWGPDQPGTLWSFASGPYGPGSPGHLGTAGILGFAGWKGDGDPWASAWHAGTYEVYLR